MTVTRLSGCFVALLIWGCTAVVCLVDEQVTVQPLTTAAYHTPDVLDDSTVESTFSFACGNNSHSCAGFCGICEDFYHAPTMECLSTLLHHICLSKFVASMASINSTDWCVWRNVNSLYSNLSLCTEDISDCLLIPWPNLLVEQMFVDIHSQFFKDCPTEELSDPPPVVVFALVITPICLIPVMVSLVVLKTKNGDGSS